MVFGGGVEGHLLLFLVEEHRSPTRHEAWLSGEPEQHQQHKHQQHIALRIGHIAKLLVFILNHLVRRPVSFRFGSTSKWFLEAEESYNVQYQPIKDQT